MANTNLKEKISADRRRFLTTFALGAAAAPLVSLGRSVLAGSGAAQTASLCYSNKRVLRDTDLQYLGAMRVPATGVRMDFSYGQLTGRKVNGRVQLIMSGNQVMGSPVYEFADTGSYHADPAQAPRMSLVRAWGDIYGGLRQTWDSSGALRTFPISPGGIYWNETRQMLYWVFYDNYNVTHFQDWCLGASRLDPNGPAAFGPWRPSGDGKKGPWRCINVCEHPSGEMLTGSKLQSGNSYAPWGPDMWAGQFPTASTPAGFNAPDLPIQKYLTYYTMIGRIGIDGKYTGNLTACRRPGDYFFEPIGAGYQQIDPTKNGGVGSWTELDEIGGLLWIDLPDVHGVLFTGKLAADHVWYSNVGVGTGSCSHGVPSPVAITGPVCTNAYPVMIIYDPADLDAVRAGRRTDYTVDPVQIINCSTRFGLRTAGITQIGSARHIDGIYLDAATRKLYVAAPESDTTISGLWNPLVHVFQIS